MVPFLFVELFTVWDHWVLVINSIADTLIWTLFSISITKEQHLPFLTAQYKIVIWLKKKKKKEHLKVTTSVEPSGVARGKREC